ncbi:VTT domain-containing protein [Myxococcota bacterium]|nr:VTT domain-containing protein [Myxococcota bacterium]
MTGGGPVLVPGRTCQARKRADRLKVLVDGQDYFRALAESLTLARHRAMVVGWDIAAETELWRGDDPGPPIPADLANRGLRRLPRRLGPLLDELVRRRRRLWIHVLAWDFGTVFAVKRGFVPVYHLDWDSHRRVRVRLDSAHPFGASVHVKTACVDDTVAFAGGLDLTRLRWDRPGHAPDDPLRRDPDGAPTPPWHDLQLMVEGPAARMVGAWIRDRWRLATGQRLPPAPQLPSAWPAGLRPDLEGVHVGLVRTAPSWDDRPAVREIEALYLEVIGRARRLVYLEHQYTTARSISEALARRLQEPDGPEVVLVTSQRSAGWLEQASMDVRRAAFLDELRRADRHGRLRVLWPRAEDGQPIKVHSKLAMVDDWYLSVGSANLANRSMGLDVELDLAVEAEGSGEDRVRAFVPALRHRLLAEHLGLPAEEVAREVAAHAGRLGPALDALRGRAGEKNLVPLELALGTALVPDLLSDPEGPLDLPDLAARALPDGLPRSVLALALRAGTGLLVFASLEAAWHGLPSSLPASPEQVVGTWLQPAAALPATIPATLLALVLAGALPLPMGALICLVGFAFGLEQGVSLVLAGATPGALLGFALGRLLGANRVRAAAVPRLNALSRRLARGGMLSVAELRVLPRHAWAEVNLVAGASHVDLRDFMAGTVVGLAPGALVLCAAGALVGAAVRDPGLVTVPVALVVLALLAAGMGWLWRRQELIQGG